jgi:hypothetical protein
MAVKKYKVQGVSDIFVDSGSGGGATVYPTAANFPTPPASTDTQLFVIASDTGALYCSFNGSWCVISILAP